MAQSTFTPSREGKGKYEEVLDKGLIVNINMTSDYQAAVMFCVTRRTCKGSSPYLLNGVCEDKETKGPVRCRGTYNEGVLLTDVCFFVDITHGNM